MSHVDEKPQRPMRLVDYLAATTNMASLLAWVWREMVAKDARRFLAFALLGTIAMALILAAQPLAFAGVLHALGVNDGVGTLFLFALLAGLFVLRLVIQWLTMRWRETAWNRTMASILAYLDRRFTEKTLGQHIEEGGILNYTTVEKGRARLEGSLQMILFESGGVILQLAASYLFMWWVGVWAGLVATLIIVIHVGVSVWMNHHTAAAMEPISENFRLHARQTTERYEKIEGLKARGMAQSEHERLVHGLLASTLRADLQLWLRFIDRFGVRDAVVLMVVMAALGYGLLRVWMGDLHAGMLLPLYVYLVDLMTNLGWVGHAQRHLTENAPYIEKLQRALTMPVLFKEDEGEVLPPGPVSIELRNVSYTTPGGHAILRDVSMAVRPGERVALIGPSGAGKTTIMKLLLRYMDPTEGDVMVNDRSLREIALVSYLRLLGYIPQQPHVWDGRLTYNLRFGTGREVPDEEVREVMGRLGFLRDARLAADPLVGKDGVQLSGGQRQRLLVGAAMLKQARFLLIDEATSSLDATTEKEVLEALSTALSQNGVVGVLIITHRLETVRHLCTRFVFLRPLSECGEGKPQVEAEASSFEELAKKSENFRLLCRDQGIHL